jgi:rhodanese-related sulfurtransferase
MPWELAERIAREPALLVVDVREPAEVAAGRIRGSVHVPRGLLEAACSWDYDDTVPALAAGRERSIAVVCRSGQRSLLAADVLQQLGYADVVSLKTGVRGWNDAEQPLVDADGRAVDGDAAEAQLAPRVRADQQRPKA